MKCIVKDCINQTHEGQFVGELCAPCHKFVTTGKEVHSQAYRNAQRTWVGLTVEEIERIYNRYGGEMINCARAIERAHGIKENT
jgi:hypothetical protein